MPRDGYSGGKRVWDTVTGSNELGGDINLIKALLGKERCLLQSQVYIVLLFQ
jgi:hypothetical protein